MSDLFEAQDEVTQNECDAYARSLAKSSVTPLPWQGFHSYTLLSASGIIVQFRSEASPLDNSTVKIAKSIHPYLTPTTTYHGSMPNSSVTVWVMDALPGIGFLFTVSSITPAKQDITITDLAKFYAESWENAQAPVEDKNHLYNTKLEQLRYALPTRFTPIIERIQSQIVHVVDQVPWVLTHQDLSNTNILVGPDSGHLTGVVDWADAAIEPFGIALWGLESILGCSGPGGWSYFLDDSSHSRTLFRQAFLAEIGAPLSDQICKAIDELRNLGILLRYGFTWESGVEEPVNDVSQLDMFLGSELFQTNTELGLY
ncbi:hypothetical protein J3459_007468 [Metarhizium acridum]|uniref:uncharacterized protein n=1 Tax=Metarhizium acridum TaxID=92637 RepID=UPI001C6B6B6D|nr:hypothetical protein J3458_003255 [Metarhizium acridum]KAG8427152.1 hypothetical protein J3459_007468 [Metarhizium acridum]